MNGPVVSMKIQIPCKYLRTNNMYYNDSGQEEEQSSNSIFWCTKTHEAFGPDGEPASKTDCCTERTCHVV